MPKDSGELRVSPSALSWRLHNLGLVDEVQWRQLCRLTLRECAERGGWAEEHLALTRSQSDVRRPGLLSREVLDAFAHGDVSARVAARVLGIPPETLLPAAPSTLPGSEDGHCTVDDPPGTDFLAAGSEGRLLDRTPSPARWRRQFSIARGVSVESPNNPGNG